MLPSLVFSWHGAPGQVIDAGRLGIVNLHSSQPLLHELANVLERPKFRKRIEEGQTTPRALLDAYEAIVTLCQPLDVGKVIVEDPADDVVLGTAAACEAQFIVSGNGHLLKLRIFRGIRIATANELLELIRRVS